ncbi:MAG TPA: ABC-type transport auxiliary lipoprotein family protein [Xanthomonadaceae bacterium]|nr:ABC-type transport auxiliary lipoprotein family protein [Xanthomonadaceae bacterium]
MSPRPIIAAAASLLLAGCITVGLGGSDSASLTTYTLSATRPPAEPVPPVNWQLVVDKPSAAKALASNRIVVMPRAHVLNVYEGAQWSDRTPEMLQTLLIQGLEASGSITAVDRPVSGLRGDYTLVSEVRAFQAEYGDDGPPEVHVSLSLRLLQPARNRILAATTVTARQPARATDIASVVRAFDRATASVIAEAVAWTLESGEANRHSGPPEPWR